ILSTSVFPFTTLFRSIAARIAMACSSNASLAAAVLAGFAVAPMAASQLVPGIVAVPAERGLPALPDAEFSLFMSRRVDPALGQALTAAVLEGAATRPVRGPA